MTSSPSPTRYDVIVIGAGHNGLVTAAYLARSGLRVLVLERRPILGGACCTEELVPGFHFSTAAYVNGLLRAEIIADLKLADHGFVMLQRDPASFTPLLDGRSLLMGPDMAQTQAEIAAFSEADARALVAWEAMLDRVTAAVDPVLSGEPTGLAELLAGRASHSGWPVLADLSADQIAEIIAVFTGSASDLLRRYFVSEPLLATLATDGVIGTLAPPSAPGTGYVLFHHVMGETFGHRGVWSYVRGGMGALAGAIAGAARAAGAATLLDAPVDRIVLDSNGATSGVALTDGRQFHARVVVSNATPHVTFGQLLDTGDRARWLPANFAAALEGIDYRSASVKINVALSGLPNFACRPTPAGQAGGHHRGTFHIAPTLDYIERAYDTAKYGEMSAAPIIEGALPSAVDNSLAPAGCHVLSLFTQYAPYQLANGPWDQAARDQWANRVFDLIEAHAPGFRSLIVGYRLYAPPDLEATFGLTGGNIFQGAMSLGQLYAQRPVPGWGRYRTPVRGLYLCGASTSPGGGVMGTAGRNASRAVLADFAAAP